MPLAIEGNDPFRNCVPPCNFKVLSYIPKVMIDNHLNDQFTVNQ